jgi:hypothetical protein
VVLVAVCNENGIQFFDLFPQQLLPEIGAGVNHNNFFSGFNKDGRPQALVFPVAFRAYFARAGNNRNALRSSGTKEGDLHLIKCD